MRLTPWEEERLLIFGAAELARRHRAAGLELNAPEAVALICDAILEAARAGSSYAAVEAAGLAAVSPDEVLPGVRELVDQVALEVLLGDGARLIVLVDPLGRGEPAAPEGPGAIVAGDAEAGPRPPSRKRLELEVTNTSRRVVRVSSHFPFHRGSLRHNRATAPIEVDPVDGRVTLHGRPLAAEPLAEVPLSRRYFLR